uniref:Uncharacterized protein n=1 Tax=viral metagenome TaxID=1070528 RepID=A0A6C0E904_9ZZZZ
MNSLAKENVRTICYYSTKTGKVNWYFTSSRNNLDIKFSKEIRWKELKLNIELASDLEVTSNDQDINTRKLLSQTQKISLLLSNLQIAIRRQNLNCAIEIATQLYNIDQLGLLQKLSIISLDDVILLEDYPYLLFIITVYPTIKVELDMVLRIVECLVKSNRRDYLPDDDSFVVQNINLDFLIEIEKKNLNDLEISLIYSLYLRASYGGLDNDIYMLIGYCHLWKDRFMGQNRDIWDNHLLKTPTTLDSKIAIEGETVSIIQDSVNFYICPNMLKDINININARCGCKINEDKLKKIIWYCSSGVNTRGNSKDFLQYRRKYYPVFAKLENIINTSINTYSSSKIKIE